MGLKNLFKKDYVIGLDMGASAIKIALFREAEDGLRLVKAEVRELAPYIDDTSFCKVRYKTRVGSVVHYSGGGIILPF